MRNKIDLSPNRYKTTKTSRSNLFVSSFKSKETNGGIVEKTSIYNWTGYIKALIFTLIVLMLTCAFFWYLLKL
jgi:hypothetical protein